VQITALSRPSFSPLSTSSLSRSHVSSWKSPLSASAAGVPRDAGGAAPVSGEDVASPGHAVHPTLLAQEGQPLIYDCDTIHRVSSLPGTLPVYADETAS